MITYSDIIRYDNRGFSEYLNSPGHSYTGLKKNCYGVKFEIKETDKMLLGIQVDKILMAPHEADMTNPFYEMAKNIAAKISKDFPYLVHFDKQVCFSGVASYNGFYLPVKGRLDYYRSESMVIDLKVTHSRNINNIIRHFEYNTPL